MKWGGCGGVEDQYVKDFLIGRYPLIFAFDGSINLQNRISNDKSKRKLYNQWFRNKSKKKKRKENRLPKKSKLFSILSNYFEPILVNFRLFE